MVKTVGIHRPAEEPTRGASFRLLCRAMGLHGVAMRLGLSCRIALLGPGGDLVDILATQPIRSNVDEHGGAFISRMGILNQHYM